MSHKSYREQSRLNWGISEGELNLEQIKAGALLRMADALELAAKNYQTLINERDLYKNYYHEKVCEINILYRRIAGLKGHIKRIKKK